MLTVPVVSRATVTTLDVSVTSAFSGDGAAVANTDASVTVEVKNLNQAGDVYYRIGSGSWVNVLARQSTLLTLDLSAATLYLKRGQYSDTVAVRLTINGVPSGLYADATSLAAGGGASAFTDLTDAPASYSGHGGKAVSVKSDASGLEFTADGGGGSGLLLSATVTLTDAQIKDLYPTTVEIIPAPGAGKMILPVSALLITYGSTPYSVPGVNRYLRLGTSDGYMMQINESAEQILQSFGGAVGFLTISQKIISSRVTGEWVLGLDGLDNKAIRLSVDSTTITGGDPANLLKVVVLYTVIDV